MLGLILVAAMPGGATEEDTEMPLELPAALARAGNGSQLPQDQLAKLAQLRRELAGSLDDDDEDEDDEESGLGSDEDDEDDEDDDER